MSLFTKSSLAAINGRTAFGSGSAYFFGGFDATPTMQSDGTKYAFSNDARSAAPNGLAATRWGTAGFAYPQVAGYITGGSSTFGGSTPTNTIYKFNVNDDSRTTLSGTLTTSRYYHTSAQNNGVAGYIIGGSTASGTYTSSVEKLNVASDTASTTTSLPAERTTAAGVSRRAVAAYALGGTTTAIVASIIKCAFPTDTVSTLGNSLPAVRTDGAGVSDDTVAGYVAGGQSSTTAATSAIAKLTYSNETTSTISATLQSARSSVSGCANLGTAGYICGGRTWSAGSPNAQVAHVDKLTFSGETTSTLTSLAAARASVGAFGSA